MNRVGCRQGYRTDIVIYVEQTIACMAEKQNNLRSSHSTI